MLKMLQPASSALANAILAGGQKEEQAIAYLIEKDFEKIRSLVMKNNGTLADAEDVFQEGLTALILNIRKGSFKGESSMHTYLYAICRGIWFKRFRKWNKEQDNRALAVEEQADHRTPEISLMEAEQKQLLLKLFDHLREKCKEVLYLWASAYSMQEIASQLGYTSSQVAMNKKNKCLKQLHQLIGEDERIQQLLNEL